MQRPTLPQWMIAFSVLGIVDASYGLIQHFGPVGSGVCNWGAHISCDIVNKSIFSEFFGIPVALIGLVGYLTMGAIAWCIQYRQKNLARELAAITALGFFISAYLTFIEIYYLRAVCPICALSQIIMLILLVLSILSWRKTKMHPVVYS